MKNLSILICTLPKRKAMFDVLLEHLFSQIKTNNLEDEVEVLWNWRTDITTGYKRNLLLDESTGKFVVFIDDDDEVHSEYVFLINETIKNNSDIDCIGINGIITFDGLREKPWNISIDNKEWYETPEKYFRTPNHISPVLASIAKVCRFPNITYAEDKEYSERIKKHLKKEAKIEKPIYHYKFINDK